MWHYLDFELRMWCLEFATCEFPHNVCSMWWGQAHDLWTHRISPGQGNCKFVFAEIILWDFIFGLYPYDHSILTSWYNLIILYFEFPSLSSVSTGLEIGSIGIKPFEEIFMLNFNMHKNYLISANGLQWKFNASVSVSISIAPSFILLLAMQNFFVQM